MNERIDIAINGYGRIGTVVSRIAIDDPDLSLRAINTGKTPNPYDVAARLEFDSNYLKFGDHTVDYDKDNLIVDDEMRIALLSFRALSDARWQDIGSDSLTVIDSTGSFTGREAVQGHLVPGVRRVIITAPAEEGVPTIVRGVNDTPEYLESIKDETVFATSSCSTNAIATTLKALESDFKIKWGFAAIPHAVTSSQTLLDGYGKDTVSRRSADSIISAKTGSAIEVARLFPDLEFFHAESMRVPVAVGSVAMLKLAIEGVISAENVIENLSQASDTTHAGIIGMITGLGQKDMYSNRIIKRPESAIINPEQVSVNRDGNMSIVSLHAWFDNEWGYSNRVAEVAKIVGRAD